MLKPNTWVRYMRHGHPRVGKYLGLNGLGLAVIEINEYPYQIEILYDDIIERLGEHHA